MPPNRKTDIALQDFASLDVAQLKPSTTTSILAAAPQPKPQQRDSASYWDWPVDEEIQELQCLDTTHIEQSLIKEARRLSEKSATDSVRSSQLSLSQADSYWAMPAEKPVWFDIKRPAPSHHPASADLNADDYWNDAPAATAKVSDDYWAM